MTRSNVKISHFQVASLLAVSTIFTFTSRLPDMADHSMGRFISLLICTVILSALYTPLMLSARKESAGFVAVNNSFFKWFFGSILIIRLLFTVVLTMLQLEFRITCTAMSYISPVFYTAFVFLAVLYGSMKGLQATARVAPLVLVAYVFLIVAVSISAWDKVDVIRIYSPFSVGTDSIVKNAVMDVIRNDELFFFAVLAGYVRGNGNRGQGYKSILYYLPFVTLVGLWLNFLYNAVLGRFINSTACQMYTVSSFSSFNLLERMDGLFISTAIFAGILKITLSFVCIRAILLHLLPKERAAKCTSAVLLGVIGVLVFFLYEKYDWLLNYWLGVALAASLVIIALILPICRGKSNEQSNEKTVNS